MADSQAWTYRFFQAALPVALQRGGQVSGQSKAYEKSEEILKEVQKMQDKRVVQDTMFSMVLGRKLLPMH